MEDFEKKTTAPSADKTDGTAAAPIGSPSPSLDEEMRTLSGEELKLVAGAVVRQPSGERPTGSR